MEPQVCADGGRLWQHGAQWISEKPASLFRPIGDGGLGGALCSRFSSRKGEGMNVRGTVEVFTAQNVKEVTKIVTTSGVVGYVASDVPLVAIQGLYQKLLLQLEKLNHAAQSPSTANQMHDLGSGKQAGKKKRSHKGPA